MVRRIFFFSLNLIALYSYCMNKDKDELKQWIKNATEIKIYTDFLKDCILVTIEDTTSVIDVKSKLSRIEGIPLHRLSLHSLAKSWFVQKIGEKLANNLNIKKIMSDKDSDRFFLTVSDSESVEKK